jgi:hypothetical protein
MPASLFAAMVTKTMQVIAWRELQDDSVWRQGWV